MKNIYLVINVILVNFLLTLNLMANQPNNFDIGVKYYKKNDLKNSKISFEKDIVFNPSNEKSYLYLAKIFKKTNKIDEEEINLNSVLLLNPKNDEAIYLLTLLKINQYDFDKANELIDDFKSVCKSFCNKKNELEKKLNKIASKDEKN